MKIKKTLIQRFHLYNKNNLYFLNTKFEIEKDILILNNQTFFKKKNKHNKILIY